jgi:hypothetical protein
LPWRAPDAGRTVEHRAHDLKAAIDRRVLGAFGRAFILEALQGVVADVPQRQAADVRQQDGHVVRDDVQGADPSLLALDQVLLCSSCEQLLSAFSKFVFAPGIDLGLPRPEPDFGAVLADLAEPGEDAFALVLLVDRPFAGPIAEDAWCPSSHGTAPFVDLRLGRPRSRIYASAQASSSWRSKAMHRPPKGISVSDGRISASNRLRSTPR